MQSSYTIKNPHRVPSLLKQCCYYRLGRDAAGRNGHRSNKVLQITLALEGEGLADHHERLAAGLADGVSLNRLALTLVRNTFVGEFLETGALGGSVHIVFGQVGGVLHIDGLASLGFLLQTAGDVALDGGALLTGLQLCNKK